MLIYFSANHRHLERDLALYRNILAAIQREGHVIVNGWVEAANHKWPVWKKSTDWTSICQEARAGIDDADMLIVEASGESGFGVGFEAAYAASKGKRVIILVRESEIDNSYASGLDWSETKVITYTEKNLYEVIKAALKQGDR